MTARIGLWLFAASLLAAPASAQRPADAKAYPTKPVRMVIPFAPGGGTDIVGRIVAQKLTEAWPYAVVVDNRPGAGSTIGTEIVARALPDGYTIAESGFPGFQTDTWYGVVAPAGTPAAIIPRLNADIGRVIASPEARALLEAQGAHPAGGSPREFREFLQSEIAKWAKVIKAAGIEPF